MDPFDDRFFMKKALDEAEKAFEKGEVPDRCCHRYKKIKSLQSPITSRKPLMT